MISIGTSVAGFAALENPLRIAFVDGLPGVEVDPAVLDHPLTLHLLGLLESRVGVAHRRAVATKATGRIEVRGGR
jgi:hypothetical protein